MSNKIGNSAVHLTVAKMLTLLISLVSSVLLSHFRTLEEYGTYSQIMIAITTVSSFVMLGLPNSTNYFLARADSNDEKRNFLSVYYTLNTILCVVLGTVLVIAVPFIEKYFDNPLISNFAYFLAIYPWTSITISSISNVLVVYNKTKLLMLFNILGSIVPLVSIAVIQLCGLKFSHYMIGFLLGNVILAITIYIIVGKLENGIKIKLDFKLIRDIFKYSIPIGLAALVGTLNIETDKLMIGGLMDTESLAVYTNAGKELPLTMLATSLTAVLLPQLARILKKNKNEEAVFLWGDTVKLSYIVMCFCVTACIIFAPQIITLLYSEKYIGGVAVFRIYALVLLLRITYFGIILNSVGKTKFILWSSIIALGLNVVLNYGLFVAIGFVGPALATLLSVCLVNMLQLIVSARIVNVSFKRIFPWGELFKITLINACWGLACYFILKFFGIGISFTHILISIGIGLVFTVLYVIIMRKKVIYLWKKLNSDK